MFPLAQDELDRLRQTGPYNESGFPFYQLTAPGMPMPGPDFLAYASAFNDDTELAGTGKTKTLARAGNLLALLYFRALYDRSFALPIQAGARRPACAFLPGHLAELAAAWVQKRPPRVPVVYGPRPAPVMLIGKMPLPDEVGAGAHLSGPAAVHFWTACAELGITPAEYSSWYLTNMVPFAAPDDNASRIAAGWLADSLPLLYQQLRIVRPRFILCIGSDASKLITAMSPECEGKRGGLGVEAMRGRVVPIVYPISDAGERPRMMMSQVMTVTHPASVHRTPELMDELRRGIANFVSLTRGATVGAAEMDTDYRTIRTEAELSALVDEIVGSNNPEDKILALDAEWNGTKPWDPGAYLRTVQFSHKPKFAACVELTGPGGTPVFDTGREGLARQLLRLVSAPGMRIGGHFFRSDIPQIAQHLGVDLRPYYAPADTPEKVFEEGGWDTSLTEHSINETGLLGLENLRAKYTTMPPYEAVLDKWLTQYCRERKIDKADIDGFGDWAGDEFYYYGCCDADCTRRIIGAQIPLVLADRFGHDCRRPYWLTHRASLAVLEMEMVGITPDPRRAMQLSQSFADVRNVLVSHLQELVGWPDFNPNSDIQCRAILFGDRFGKKPAPPGWGSLRPRAGETLSEAQKRVERLLAKQSRGQPTDDVIDRAMALPGDPPLDAGNWLYVLPVGARPLNLTPLTTTGKRPMAWSKIVERGEEAYHSPSTGRETLGILSHQHQAAAVLRDIRFLTKALQTVLRAPLSDETTGDYERDDDGELVYEKGLLSFTSSDGRVHTRMLQTMETGRSSSSKPPLQNLCFDAETEILTSQGWLPVPQVTQEHRVAQFLPDNHGIEFVAPTAVISMPFEGHMVQLVGRHMDLLLTPKHRCLLYSRNSRVGWHEVTAEAWPEVMPPTTRSCHAGRYHGPTEMLTAMMSNWLVAVALHGKSPTVRDGVLQSVMIRCNTIGQRRRMEHLLRQLGVNALRTRTTSAGRATRWQFEVTRENAAPLLTFTQQVMGLELQLGAWVLNYTKSTLVRLMSDIVAWKVDPQRADFTTQSEHTANWVQILWTLCGVRARLRKMSGSDRYCVDLARTGGGERLDQPVANVKKTHVPWNAMVYCLTVPSSYLVVRRRGKVVVTGNSKRREDDYKRILGAVDTKSGLTVGSYCGPAAEQAHMNWLGVPRYQHAQRTLFRARDGHVFMEADYTGAELAGIMWLAQDPQGIEDVRRNMLPESHPDFFDIHSNSAVRAFNLDCQPTKKALKDIGKPGLRIAAKNVNFGIPYGRGAEAIARQCREEGVDASQADAQRLIDYYFQRYAKVQSFLELCKQRVISPGWMRGVFGRFRRFYATEDRALLGEAQRQACNFPIQNLVADAVWTALAEMWDYRISQQLSFLFVLQIHDAILLEVPFAQAGRVYRDVFTTCMTDRVPVWPCDLNGHRFNLSTPYRLGTDREVMFRWGESVDDFAKVALGPDAPCVTELLSDPARDADSAALLALLATHV